MIELRNICACINADITFICHFITSDTNKLMRILHHICLTSNICICKPVYSWDAAPLLYMCAYEMIAQVFYIIGMFIYCRLQITDLALCYCYILKNII